MGIFRYSYINMGKIREHKSNEGKVCWAKSGNDYKKYLLPWKCAYLIAHICCNHTLDLMLMYGTEMSHLATMPHNPVLSDHYPITFNLYLPCNINSDSRFYFRCTISSDTAKAFTDLLPGPYTRVNEDSLITTANPSLAKMNQLVDSIKVTLRKTLNAVAALKRKKILQKKG